MLGQTTARLESRPRRWLQRAWGCPDIHARQKWILLWPHLSKLPKSGVRILDAGCGDGRWAIELAAMRPNWLIIGVDRNVTWVRQAEVMRSRLGLENASFIHSDFLDFRPAEGFDVVLSVSSAHYLVELGRGADLFGRFQFWLKSGGILVLFAPRRREEVPLTKVLPPLTLRGVFSLEGLSSLCRDSGLQVLSLVPCIGRLGTAAKQLACLTSRVRLLKPVAYPIEIGLTFADQLGNSGKKQGSSAWLLVARKTENSDPDQAAAVAELSPWKNR